MGELAPGARRIPRRAAAWIAVAALGGAARAQSAESPLKPIGFPWGAVVLGPSLTTGYSYNTNIFLNTKDLEPTPDEVLTVQPAVQLTVPFANSWFRFGDTLRWVDYNKTPQTAGKTSNDAEAELALNFGSRDSLVLSAHNINGVAETLAFDPGGEVIFRGEAYKLHTEAIAASRDIPESRGYRLSITRNALNYTRNSELLAFDFSGFDAEAAYVQPVSSSARLSFGYLGSRYDHFDVSPGADPTAVFRTERGDTLYAQIDGLLGPRQPYSARLGWERLDFTGNAAKDYAGLIGLARMSAIVGGGTTITGTLQQQPFRSFFGENNFYLYDAVTLRVERPFPSGTVFGGDSSFSINAYDEPSPISDPPYAIFRKDRTIWFEGYANLAISEHARVRFTVSSTKRYSNYPGADYQAVVVFGGFVFGWI
jgi:hypothetical protein